MNREGGDSGDGAGAGAVYKLGVGVGGGSAVVIDQFPTTVKRRA